ncbi:hypothetical protein ACWCSD_42365 [Nonomuraea sp. NPDC001684]
MSDTPDPDPLPAWERNLLGQPVTTEERAQLDQEAAEAARREADRRQAWPLLHDVADGGTVDLNDVWYQLEPERWELDPGAVVELLADRAGGVGRRLHAGVQSLLARRDGNINLWSEPDPDQHLISVVAWSFGGHWSPDRAWWARCTLDVSTDQYGEVRLTPHWGVEFAVSGRGGATVFLDNEHGILGPLVARWYLGWLGRRAVRDQLGHPPYGPAVEAISLNDFLAQTEQSAGLA